MKLVLVIMACTGLVLAGCRKRKTEPPPTPAAPTSAVPETPPSGPAATPVAAPPAKPALTPAQVEASVEFGDLNNLIAGFEIKNKRLPTVEELKRLYYGGTKPIPVPPGYRLVIDPKTKTAKAISGN